MRQIQMLPPSPSPSQQPRADERESLMPLAPAGTISAAAACSAAAAAVLLLLPPCSSADICPIADGGEREAETKPNQNRNEIKSM
jgi:hypothetical protein